jgi:hypothetical protein
LPKLDSGVFTLHPHRSGFGKEFREGVIPGEVEQAILLFFCPKKLFFFPKRAENLVKRIASCLVNSTAP